MFRHSDFPEMREPVYDFFLDGNGDLATIRHHRYTRIEHETGRNKFTYRIHTGTHIVTKTGAQMDRYLNNHLYTLDPDRKRARRIILEYWEAQAAAAQAMLDKANGMLALMRTPAMPFVGGAGDD